MRGLRGRLWLRLVLRWRLRGDGCDGGSLGAMKERKAFGSGRMGERSMGKRVRDCQGGCGKPGLDALVGRGGR